MREASVPQGHRLGRTPVPALTAPAAVTRRSSRSGEGGLSHPAGADYGVAGRVGVDMRCWGVLGLEREEYTQRDTEDLCPCP